MTPSLGFGHDALAQQSLINVLNAMQKVAYNVQMGSMVRAIKTGGSALVKYTAAFKGLVNGLPVTSGASGDFPALSGTVVDGTYNVFAFFIDQAGTLTSAMGTAGATLNAVVFPATPAGKAMVAFITVHPVGANFVGGTTALDAGTVTVGYYDGVETAPIIV